MIGLLTAGGAVVGGRIVDFIDARPIPIHLMGGNAAELHPVLHVLHAILIWTLAVPLMMRVRRARAAQRPEGFDRVCWSTRSASPSASTGPGAQRALAAQARLQAAEASQRRRRDHHRRPDPPPRRPRHRRARGGRPGPRRIGGREAHAALLAKIDDPDNDLTLIALRALRFTPDRRLVDRLVAHLDDDEPYVVREVVRTLGACGDARAVTPLVALLNRTPQGPLVAITAEVLGRLGDISALYVILPRFRLSATPAQRRALAVACGDLLGSPDGFYQMLTREERSAGAGVAHDLARARRALLNPLLPRRGAAPRSVARACRPRTGRGAACACRGGARRLRPGRDPGEGAVRHLAARRHDGVPGHAGPLRSRFTVGVWYLAVMNGAFAATTPADRLRRFATRSKLSWWACGRLLGAPSGAPSRPHGRAGPVADACLANRHAAGDPAP